MSKKPVKPAADATPETPRKRSKAKLAILAALPVLLAGGGYGGWTMFFAAKPAEAAAQGEGAAGAGEHGTDAIRVSAVPTEIAAETSFTHSFALSVLIAEPCGRFDAPALQAASEEEARADGMLANLSWMAAARRVTGLDPKFCGRFASEIDAAAAKATALAEAKAGPKKDAKAAAHH